MGGGSWTTTAFTDYSKKRGLKTSCSIAADGTAYTSIDASYNVQDLYRNRSLDPMLNPRGVMRECRDSEEHPKTIPVILALDVTGSMGSATAEVAKQLNGIMAQLYKKLKDVQFMIMGIGDIAYDRAPIQISQFESDIRIIEQLDKVWFEAGGGGNQYESYTAAWYMGSRHCDLDCWKRGKRGIIITLGDEPLNPYLNRIQMNGFIGDNLQDDIETKDLYAEVSEKYDVYHVCINDDATAYSWHKSRIEESWNKTLEDGHVKVATLQELPKVVSDIIINSTETDSECDNGVVGMETISW